MTDDLKARLRTAALMLPIRREDNADYAEVFGQDFQAMTMTPERFEALSALPEALARIEALEAENARLRGRTSVSEGEARLSRGGGDAHNSNGTTFPVADPVTLLSAK